MVGNIMVYHHIKPEFFNFLLVHKDPKEKSCMTIIIKGHVFHFKAAFMEAANKQRRKLIAALSFLQPENPPSRRKKDTSINVVKAAFILVENMKLCLTEKLTSLLDICINFISEKLQFTSDTSCHGCVPHFIFKRVEDNRTAGIKYKFSF